VSFQCFALLEFWKRFDALPENTQALARAKYALFGRDPFHPSLGLKQKGEVWTADVGRRHRAIAYRTGDSFHWFWIGSHEDYNQLLRRVK
jgi:hypothetical protein